MTRDELLSAIRWHPRYRSAWNDDPWAYLRHGLLPPGRTRRLGVLRAGPGGFKAYVGVQHFDPGHWGRPEDGYCRFFLSLWAGGRLRELRTHETMRQALDRLWSFYQAVGEVPPREGLRAAPGG
ncbi:MAG: hypothetical protein HYY02_11080 [Chloroflexi bacterium]|nr:hypothetical protein [Chloroflexota bacterium]